MKSKRETADTIKAGKLKTKQSGVLPKSSKQPGQGVLKRAKTERAEKANLPESEERYKSLFQFSPLAIFVWQKVKNDFILVDVNHAADALTHHKAHEFIGQIASDIYPDRPDIISNLNKCYKEKNHFSEETSYVTRSDNQKNTVIFTYTFTEPDTIMMHAESITGQKQNEEQLQLYKRAFESSEEGIIITDFNLPDNPIIFANSKFLESTGYSANEIIGINCRFLQGKDTDKDTVAQMRRDIDQKNVFEGDILNYKKDGTSYWNHLHISPIFDRNNNCTHFISIQTDVTIQKQTNEQLNIQNEYLSLLHTVTKEMLQRTEMESLLNMIAVRAAAISHSSFGYIFLSEGNHLVLRAATGNFKSNIGQAEVKPGKGVLGHVWQSMQPIVMENYDAWEGHDQNYSKWSLRAVAGVPIIANNKIMGVLEVARAGHDQRAFSAAEIEGLIRFAEMASLIVDHVQLYATAQKEIDERKLAEEKLRESEERYRIISNIASDYAFSFRVEPDGTLTREWTTESFERITGYSPSDPIVRQGLTATTYTDDLSILEAHTQRLLMGSEESYIEFRILHKDGVMRWLSSYGRSITDQPGGRVVRIYGAVQDITERKLAEEKLRESEERYRTLFENAPDLIYTLDQNNNCTSINGAGERIFGLPKEQIVGQNIFELLTSRSSVLEIEKSREMLREKITNEGVTVYEMNMHLADDSEGILEVTSWLTHNKNNQMDGLQGFVRNITKRKQAEKALQESEVQFRKIIELSPIPYALNNDQQKITYLNAAFIKTFGYDMNDIPTLEEWWPQAYPDAEYRRWVANTWQARLDNAKQHGTDFEPMEIDIHCKDGSIKTVLASAGAISTTFNDTHLVILYDITERTQAERKLNETQTLLTSMLEFSPASTYLLSKDSHFQLVNSQWEKDTQVSRANALGKSLEDIFPEPLAQKYRFDNEYVIRENSSLNMEEWAQTPHGLRCYYTIKFPIQDNHNHVEAVAGISIDITERKQAEEKVLASEERYRSLFEIETRHLREMALLDSVRALAAREIDLQILIKKVVQTIADTFGYSNISLALLENSDLVMQHQVGYQDMIERFPISQGISGRAVRTGQAILVEDVSKDPDFLGVIEGVVSQVSVPLFDKSNIIGSLTIESTGEEKLTEADLKLMIALGESIGVAVGRANLFDDVEQQNTHLKLLNNMTHTVLASDNFDDMFSALATNMTALLHADSCYITGWDERLKTTIPLKTSEALEVDFKTILFPAEERTMTKSVMEAGYILAAEDVFNSPHISPNVASHFPAKSLLGIPLILGKHKIGAALIGFNTAHQFSEIEIERAQQAGDQIALALWNTQQELILKKQLHESEALSVISLALSETERMGLPEVLQLIVNSAKDLIPGIEQAVIHLLDEEKEFLIPEALIGYENSEEGKKKMRVGQGVAGQALAAREPINIADVTTDPRFVTLNTHSTISSLVVLPIVKGILNLGTLSVQSSKLNAFKEDDVKLLQSMGIQAAIAIENAHLIEDTQQALKETNALQQVNQGVVDSLDPDEVLKDTVELLQKNFGYHYVQAYVIDPESGDFIMRAGSGKIGRQLMEQGHRIRRGEGIVGFAAETGTAFFTNDVSETVSFIYNPLLPNTKSELAMPVKAGNEILGVLDIQQQPPMSLTQRDIQLVSAVADQLTIALQKANLHKDLQTSLEQEKAVRNQLVQNERLAVMGRLLASVSHELNNPLQAIQNALFLLREEQGISAQGLQDLNIVLGESERMASLIERLRDTYRPIQAEDFHQTQINNIIEDVHALIAPHLRQQQISFEFYPEPSLPTVPALVDQVRQVILNLMMNAVEAMTSGGTLRISTTYKRESEEVELTVTDTGAGIPESILPHIFEAFVTNKAQGTGLGLTITYDIISKHRGHIQAENNPQQGATFKVWLPLENREII